MNIWHLRSFLIVTSSLILSFDNILRANIDFSLIKQTRETYRVFPECTYRSFSFSNVLYPENSNFIKIRAWLDADIVSRYLKRFNVTVESLLGMQH